MFAPMAPPKFAIVVINAIPMARRQEGARLLATQATTALTPQDTVLVGGVRKAGGLLLEVDAWKKGEGEGKKCLQPVGMR